MNRIGGPRSWNTPEQTTQHQKQEDAERDAVNGWTPSQGVSERCRQCSPGDERHLIPVD